jgi:hypothetical protein
MRGEGQQVTPSLLVVAQPSGNPLPYLPLAWMAELHLHLSQLLLSQAATGQAMQCAHRPGLPGSVVGPESQWG